MGQTSVNVAAVLVVLASAVPASRADASWIPAPQLQPEQVQAGPSFRHVTHSTFRCQDCHAMNVGHGTLLVATPSDCQSCHHAAEQVVDGCARCHRAEELQGVVHPQERLFALSVFDAPAARSVGFSHDPHEEKDCVECHQGPTPALSASEVECAGCHEEHHEPTNSGCAECHTPAPEGAHPLEVHQTCSGSGCHVDPPFPVPPRSRTGCLWCHEEQVDHESGGECSECHFVSTEYLVDITHGGR